MRNFNNYKRRIGFTIPKKYEGIINYAQKEPDLLICLREESIHIYYKGGKILDLKPNSLKFNEKYLKIDSITPNLTWLSYVKEKDIISNPKKYFDDAKEVMKLWFKKHRKQERDDQQSIAENNQYCEKNGDLAIVDIEYAVSFNSNCYNKEYKDTFREYTKYPNPRFDIIAIDKNGQLYVLELKTGLESTKNCETHITDFAAMIGSHRPGDNTTLREPRWVSFAKEMDEMILKLNEHKYRGSSIGVPRVNLDLPPKFLFVYTIELDPKCKRDTPEYQRRKIAEVVRESLNSAIINSKKRAIDDDVKYLFKKGLIKEEVMCVELNNFKLVL